MSKNKLNPSWVISIFIILFVIGASNLVQFVQCQDEVDSSQLSNPAVLQLVTQLVYAQLSNLTTALNAEIGNSSSFCITDPQADWDRAFNFSSNLEFLASCILKTNGDIAKRMCTTAEVKFYFSTFFERSRSNNYLRPNRNCNLTSWISGCEPGWACSVGQDQEVSIDNSRDIPSRTDQCDTCCEGFFCPHGLTCMIPCPLGSYCPLATLNRESGVCQPYMYQLPPRQSNHTCGGANIWADVRSSSEVFCSPGSYCPTTVNKMPCSSGHYCRTGSTSENRCFRLTSCNPNTANQNMQVYGIMFIAGLSTMLLILYNCSDQVLTIRERRLAKSREAAARNARDAAKARQRWRHAKDVALKRTAELQAHLSRTFSRKKSNKHLEEQKMLGPTRAETNGDLYPPMHPTTAHTSGQSSKEKQKETSNLTKMMNAIEHDPDSYDGFDLGPESKHIKEQHLKGKEIHTHSQIFKYAYAQLEKEKDFQEKNKDLTFSGVITMATAHTEIKRRPLIEITFKDLTITLKGKNKHLLRCVTGKINPGRITAVMGPSGAGKTTFLSALVGKTMGCKVTGLILINGVHESIHSYKKIIGFVPQDDIVHGNLTVEENLWFNARCRLSADLPKAEKVLVVERVIESLGLQAVRDSLVGTVEKRGISGGQRKRVNVGLEMVMEPSLLILDEPTSGLDSSSSVLLLRSLRREALEGVNICMVVHQPSYTLFKMFDDLVLLAKGGLTAYHGPMKKAEEYFEGIGIIIPDRVNPPDHLIDVLEGLVKPNAESGVRHEELPIRWMLHNGYQVPPDMKRNAPAAGVEISATNVNLIDGINHGDVRVEDYSFAGELWQDVKSTVELHQDKIRHNFLRTKDLSKRRTPGLFLQYKYFLGRVSKQRLRESRLQAIDYLILLMAGACLGSLIRMSDETFGAAGYTYTIIAMSLLCKIAALRSFSLDKLQYWRESASGMSSLAFFLSKDTVDHLNTLIKPLVYLSMFYFFSNPRSSFLDNYIVLVCLVYCVTGIAYVLAIFLESGPAQLWSVLLPVILTLIATQPRDSEFLKFVSQLCYSKWALEAFVIANAERYYGVWLITRCGALSRTGYNLHDWGLCIAVLILTGVAGRIIAFIGMVIFQRK